MNTLLFIHGGESFVSDAQYHAFLRETYVGWQSESWTPEERKDWVQAIAQGWYAQGGRVLKPVFPNKLNARYMEWKIVFEGLLQTLSPEDTLTLIGGSLGGCFLLKYFAEEKNIPCTLKQIHLMAACISVGDFAPPEEYDALKNLRSLVHIWHAEDDPIVPFSIGQTLAAYLPDAQIHFFPSERGYRHFHGAEKIPELESILGLKSDLSL